jgi:hypothetical protein
LSLQQLRQQFDILPPESPLDGYELVMIPEMTEVDADLKAKLRDYLRNGGSLILCGPAALDSEGRPVLEEQGIEAHGPSPYSHTFLHAASEVSQGLADYGYVMYEPGFRMTPKAGAQALVAVGEPYFQRDYHHFSGHEYTPEDRISPYAAVVRNGNVITFSVPILEAYGKHASPNYRLLLGNCLRLLLPRPLIQDEGPSKLETTVIQTDRSTVVHLLSFCPERRADKLDIVEDPFPIVDMPFAVKADHKPHRVFLAPNEQDLDFEYRGGYVHTRITFLTGHTMLVIER